MKPILVVYGSTEGQTRKIAQFIAARFEQQGREVHLVDSASPAAAEVTPIYAGAVLGGSLHQHKHQAALVHFVKANVEWLNTLPTAFFSVSLSMAGRDAQERAEAKKLAEGFLEDTGLAAGMLGLFAGALKYTEYDFLKRFIMRRIAQEAGGDTDTSHDHEYTDWDEVARFADDYLAAMHGAARRAA